MNKFYLGELFHISTGVGAGLTEQVAYANPGKLPVISSQTTNEGVAWRVDEKWARSTFPNFVIEQPCLTWTKDGAKAGTFFKRTTAFLPTGHCGVLIEKKPGVIDLDFALLVLPDFCRPFILAKETQPMLGVGQISSVELALPSIGDQHEIVDAWKQFTEHKIKTEEKLKLIEESIMKIQFGAIDLCH